MTTEEKSKAYDEALERAKEMMNNDCSSETTKAVCQEIFPSLVDSENERIRKEILDFIQLCLSRTDFGSRSIALRKEDAEMFEKWIAYLEKQKEQKPAEWSEEDERKIGRLRSIVNECASRNYALDVNGDYCEGDYAELDEWLKSLRPQSLWKPSEEQMSDYKVGDKISWKWKEYTIDACYPQPKQEWSEADEENIGRLRSVVNKCAFYDDALDVNGDYCEGDYAELDEWLKSLSLNLKKKNEDVAKLCSNEWSEEDEIKIHFLKALIQNQVRDCDYLFGHNGKDYVSKQEAIEMLSSLRPSWKPSEEQMEALDEYIYAKYPDTEKYSKAILSLKEELKKLI